jgi:hypothetical protein
VAEQQPASIRRPDRNREVFGRIDERHLIEVCPVRVGGEDVCTTNERDLSVRAGYRRPGWKRRQRREHDREERDEKGSSAK